MSRRIAGTLLCALNAALWLSACGAEEPPPARNVLLIVVDTLRWDHVGSYGASQRDTTPAIDAFARDSIRFERAYATAPWTRPSIGSMITGLYPSSHGGTGVDIPLPDDAVTLAEILWQRGYSTQGVVSNWVISRGNGFAQGFDDYHESASIMQQTPTSEHVTAASVELLEKLAGKEAPFFLFVHYFEPHFRYLPHPEIGWAGEARSDGPGEGKGEGKDERKSEIGRIADKPSMFTLRMIGSGLDAAEIENLRDLYAEEIRHADGQVGVLLDSVASLGLMDDTVIAIVSDHGEEIFDRDYIGHAHSLYEELIRVPFLLHVPGVGPQTVASPVSLVSLTPTLLEAAGVAPDDLDFQASSLLWQLSDTADGDDVYHFVEVDFIPEHKILRTSRRQGIVGRRFKLLRNLETGEHALYDIIDDPHELDDLSSRRPELLRELIARLDAAVEYAGERAVHAERRQLSENDRAMLEQLGYIDPEN
jgi:arylsulfatase A-like enzyme